MSNMNRIVMSFAAGAVIGGLTGLLMAPASGVKTRKKMLKEARRFQHDVSNGIKHSVDDLKHTYNDKVRELASFARTKA
jgi:gas vesicle protein